MSENGDRPIRAGPTHDESPEDGDPRATSTRSGDGKKPETDGGIDADTLGGSGGGAGSTTEVPTTDPTRTDASTTSIPSIWKVRGELPDAGATGVFGYSTATTGAGRGVQGRVDSGGSGATGVEGRAAASGVPAAVEGVLGVSEADADAGGDVYPVGVHGRTTATTGPTFGTLGETGTTAGPGAVGLSTTDGFTFAYSTAGATGVTGLTDKSASTPGLNFAAGTEGVGVGDGWKVGVSGWTNSRTDGATGVQGDARAASGSTVGVAGYTASGATNTAGVYGEVYASGPGSRSGYTNGVYGFDPTSLGTGVFGEATHGSSFNYGVYGRTTSTGGFGVYGEATRTTGVTYGVYAESNAPGGYGVFANNTAGGPALRASGDASVTGSMSVGDLGVEAYRSSGAGDQTVSGTSPVTVVFDAAPTDDRAEYDETTGTFTCANDGDYLVTTGITWATTNVDQGEQATLYVYVNGTEIASTTLTAPATGSRFSLSLSKTLRNLIANDAVTVRVSKTDASDWEVVGDRSSTWMEISQVG